MAVVAQLVEPRVVISVVVGSSPISRPNFYFSLFIYPLLPINNDTGFGRRFFVPACLYRDLMLGAHICHSIV